MANPDRKLVDTFTLAPGCCLDINRLRTKEGEEVFQYEVRVITPNDTVVWATSKHASQTYLSFDAAREAGELYYRTEPEFKAIRAAQENALQ